MILFGTTTYEGILAELWREKPGPGGSTRKRWTASIISLVGRAVPSFRVLSKIPGPGGIALPPSRQSRVPPTQIQRTYYAYTHVRTRFTIVCV